MTAQRDYIVTKQGNGFSIHFEAMASPCEVIVEVNNKRLVNTIAEQVTQEVWRIQDKYSRYNQSSLCSAINGSNGQAVPIDDETFSLLAFAEQCYQISDGKFDITSGILAKVWHFDGSDQVPSMAQVNEILPFIGWQKVQYGKTYVKLPTNMAIDFGGIGKEYAVDKVVMLIKQLTDEAALVNFGGDLAVTSARKNGEPWRVGIDLIGLSHKPKVMISFNEGAIATSGDANRYLVKNDQRYSHILDPQTGCSVLDAPSSITVAASSCLNAGMAATLAMLQGRNAEHFLQSNEFRHWLFRDDEEIKNDAHC